MTHWQTDSWRNFTAKHIPDYPDGDHLAEVEKTLQGITARFRLDEASNNVW